MAKKSSTAKKPDLRLAILHAALTRAIKALEGMIGKAELPAGGYPVNVDVHIEGDVSVAASSGGASKTVPAFTTAQLAAAMFHAAGDDAAAIVGRAVTAIKQARSSEKMAGRLEDAGEACAALAEKLAFARGVTEEKASAAKRGAVTGKPAVTVAGTVGAHTLEVDLD